MSPSRRVWILWSSSRGCGRAWSLDLQAQSSFLAGESLKKTQKQRNFAALMENLPLLLIPGPCEDQGGRTGERGKVEAAGEAGETSNPA